MSTPERRWPLPNANRSAVDRSISILRLSGLANTPILRQSLSFWKAIGHRSGANFRIRRTISVVKINIFNISTDS